MEKRKRDLFLVPILSTLGFIWIAANAGWFSGTFITIIYILGYFTLMAVLSYLKYKYWIRK